MTNTYNGWENRETWLANLYFSESFVEYTKELMEDNEGEIELQDLSSNLEEYLESLLEEELENISPFLKDFIDLGLINFEEIAENLYEDALNWYKENN